MSLYEDALKMMGSSKPKKMALKESPPRSREEAARLLGQMGDLRRSVARIEQELEAQISLLRQQAEADASPYAEKFAGLEQAVTVWAEANREDLTNGGKSKTVTLGSGTIEWRNLPPSVKLKKVDNVIAAIELMGKNDAAFMSFLRIKQEPNKEAMLANPELACQVPGVTIASAGEVIKVLPLEVELAAAKSIN
jgi:phage host-nuclease inhibitor protein Gam